MGIRKVLGASIPNIFTMLTKEFMIMVVLAFLIAIPIAWYSMNQWLQNFAYTIDIQWWVFGLTFAFALLISILTISYQDIRAALINPVNCLRSE